MGEPLLYEHFERIVRPVRAIWSQAEPDDERHLPRLGVNAWAERIVPVTSDVKISWNGATKATQESVMVGVRWEKVLENVRSSSRSGIVLPQAVATAAA